MATVSAVSTPLHSGSEPDHSAPGRCPQNAAPVPSVRFEPSVYNTRSAAAVTSCTTASPACFSSWHDMSLFLARITAQGPAVTTRPSSQKGTRSPFTLGCLGNQSLIVVLCLLSISSVSSHRFACRSNSLTLTVLASARPCRALVAASLVRTICHRCRIGTSCASAYRATFAVPYSAPRHVLRPVVSITPSRLSWLSDICPSATAA